MNTKPLLYVSKFLSSDLKIILYTSQIIIASLSTTIFLGIQSNVSSIVDRSWAGVSSSSSIVWNFRHCWKFKFQNSILLFFARGTRKISAFVLARLLINQYLFLYYTVHKHQCVRHLNGSKFYELKTVCEIRFRIIVYNIFVLFFFLF